MANNASPAPVYSLDAAAEAACRLIASEVQARTASERKIAAGVKAARKTGATWGQIGYALGTSAQGAQQRFGK